MEYQGEEKSTHTQHILYCSAQYSGTDSYSPVHCNPKFLCNRNEELSVVCPVNYPFRETLDYRTYLLADKSSHHEQKVVRSVDKLGVCLQGQMKLKIFDSLDLIFILSFLVALDWREIQM